MRVEINRRWAMSVTVDARDFGKLFAEMNCREQVAVLRAMIEEMEPHQMQWDYIALELEADDNRDLVRKLEYVLETLMGVDG